MLLILSGRTVTEDIALQFGPLPPSFLPLGDQRLFSVQGAAALEEPVAITLPEKLEMSAVDRVAIEAAGFQTIFQPPGLPLTKAIRHALDHLDLTLGGPLRVLYGDTLVSMPRDLLTQDDIVAVQDTTANYPWAFVQSDGDRVLGFSDAPPDRLDSRRVVCGYFTFSDPELLRTACNEVNIVSVLNFYNSHKPLTCVEAENWFDFGHLPLYFQSKRQIMVKRFFNDLHYENDQLLKQSSETLKIRAEAQWYENLPAVLRLHVPRYGGRVERDFRAGYQIEYLYHPLISDLAAFGWLPLTSWLEIVAASFDFVVKCQQIRPAAGSPEAAPEFAAHFFQSIIVDKTWERLEAYCASTGCSLDQVITLDGVVHPPLRSVVEGLIARIPPTCVEDIRFWHGDLFFGNMFYDFTAQRIMCIDPRGQLAKGELSNFGDLRYDLAKLAHSIIGQYDKIVLGRSRLDEIGPYDWQFTVDAQPHQQRIDEIFLQFTSDRCGMEVSELMAMTALLFFSMLPLHSDRPDLQCHFLAMGLRLAQRAKPEMSA